MTKRNILEELSKEVDSEEIESIKEEIIEKPTEKKNYLEELAKEANSKKIESFQEETVERIEKKAININPKIVVGGVVGVIIVLFAAYFFFFRASIEMPDFVNKTQNDVGAWAKQYDIDTSGIIFMEEYSLEYDKDTIISQSVEVGSNVKTDVKITFVESKGANPDEAVEFPDLMVMTEEEVREWIADNKLAKTKINTQFSATVEDGGVISYDLKNVDPDKFIRGTTLTINISKGPQPAGTVTVEDFKGKDQAVAEAWATKNKIELIVSEVYHDETAPRMIISQSVEAQKTMKEGETLTITVSKGKAIRIPDFTAMSKEDFDAWKANKDNTGITFVTKEKYNTDWTKYILSQSVRNGTMVASGDVVELDVSIGDPRLDVSTYIGQNMQSLTDWCNNQRIKGADMAAGEWGTTPVYSQTYRKGAILSITCADSKGNSENCNGNLPLDTRFSVVLSKGIEKVLTTADLTDSASMANFLAANQFVFSTETVSGSISSLKVNGSTASAGTIVREGDPIVLKIASQQPTISKGIKLTSPPTVELSLAGTDTAIITTETVPAGAEVTYTSDSAHVTVDSPATGGNITAVSTGTSIITATVTIDGEDYKVTVTVNVNA